MKRNPVPSLLAAVAALVLGGSAHASASFKVTDLVNIDRVGAPVVSADGRQLAYTVRQVTDASSYKAVNRLYLLDLASGSTRALSATTASVASPQWSPDGRAIYFASARGGSNQVWRLPLDGGEAEAVTQLPLDVDHYQLSPDGRRLALAMRVFTDCQTEVVTCTAERLKQQAERQSSGVIHDKLFARHWDSWSDGRQSQLFVQELGNSATPRWISKGLDADIPATPFGDFSDLRFSPDSRTLVYAARITGRSEPWSTNLDLYASPVDGSAAPRNLTADNPAWDAQPRISADGKSLYYLAMKRPGFEADRFALMVRPLAGGSAREVAPAWDRSIAALELAADGRSAYVTADHLGRHPLFSIDLRNGKLKQLTDSGSIGGFAESKSGLIVLKNDLATPPELYRLGRAGGALQRLSHHTDAQMAPFAMARYRQFDFAGANDERVYGYVMEPAGYVAGQRYPLAFVIHGGPQGSIGDAWHFRWNMQLFAAMGYAVVFIDFHGSTGYGQAFTDSISQDWGGKPLTDLQLGLKAALAANPWIDGERACALGASYGGFMINWIAGHWADGFRCLVNHDGVFDQRSMYYSTEELWFPEWEMGAPYFVDASVYERNNPVLHVANWRTPMLVIHGAQDFRVPLEQGLAAFTALQRQGIPSKLLYFPDENHWVLKPANSVLWYQTIEAWLTQWTAPAAP